MEDIWRETAEVRFGSVDRSDRLTLWSVFNFFQEAAISSAENLGVGRDAMKNAGQVWLLSRLSLFIERRPAFGETIRISTWPRRWDKLFALRDYEIRDANDVPVVRGRGSWLALDIERRRPVRVQSIIETLPPNDGIDAFSMNPVSLDAREDLKKHSERNAAYSDIDYYGHVNNARYIQWIQDATDIDILSNADELRLDINYMSEVAPGETVEFWVSPLESFFESGTNVSGVSGKDNPRDYPATSGACFAYEGRRPDAGQTVFRAELRTGNSVKRT
ncbi:MAG: acyl-ACP thioesterase [Treponema sp.]|jgi:acyl-ACP thioesterase|nr:acyl-ACP thioesterase [Treponema sp.]